MAIQAATIKVGRRNVVVVAVRPAILDDDGIAQGVMEALRSAFPDRDIALVASRSDGPRIVADKPDTEASLRKRGLAHLNWQPYAFA